jgi:hypothetical protein
MQFEDRRERVCRAVAFFWGTRRRQTEKQRARGRSDQGARAAVTGGHQMDGFLQLLTELILRAGMPRQCVFYEKKLELPGYFRAEKKWDLLVVHGGQLIAVIEAKSHVGPSFGNNFNNRCEEAIGSAIDLWTAFREGALKEPVAPWLGYVFLLEDCPESRRPVRVNEPHFPVMPEFVSTSYTRRYELLCRKLVRERHYNAAAFLTSPKEGGLNGMYDEPADDLRFDALARLLGAHLSGFAGREGA